MRYEEIMQRVMPKRMPKTLSNEEHELQGMCVDWFAWQYPKLRGLLFAVPNGGYRSRTVAAKMKVEGVVAGVSDLVLLSPMGGSPLLIEMKTRKGAQSLEQKEWQSIVEAHGHRYVICRSLEEFQRAVKGFIK